MDVIRSFWLLVFVCPFLSFSQEGSFPRDTIYVLYQVDYNPDTWNDKFEREYKGQSGIFFNVEEENRLDREKVQ